MARKSTAIFATAGLLALGACADSTAPVSTPASPTFDRAATPAGTHLGIVPTRAMAQRSATPTGFAGTGISFHGGPVLTSGTNVAAIYWAGSTIYSGGPTPGTHGAGSADGSKVGFLMAHLGGTPYFNINHSYWNSAGTLIANKVTYTQYWANNSSYPTGTTSVSDAQMVAMLQNGFDSGALTYNASTLYNIFTAGSVNLGGGFGTQYCAYHTHGYVTIAGVKKRVLYSAMPYNYAKASACTNGTKSPNGDPGADAEVNTLTHEIEETTTDEMGNAWYDASGYENADKCAWTWGSTYTTANGGTANMNIGGKDWLIQENWVNAGTGGCKKSY